MNATEWVDVVSNGGALVLLGGVLYYGLARALPAMQSVAIEAVKANTHALEHQSRMLARLTVAIIQHDAQVRGVNPNTLGSTEELLRKVLETNGR